MYTKIGQTLGVIIATLAIGFIGHLLLTSSAAHAQPPFTTIITIDTTADPDDDRTNYTCNFTLGSGALGRPAPDGQCTLRRALVEASLRPQVDRPIAIHFNIPTSEPGYSPEVSGTWVISVTISVNLSNGCVILSGCMRRISGVEPQILRQKNSLRMTLWVLKFTLMSR